MHYCRLVTFITAFIMLITALVSSRTTGPRAIYQGLVETSARVCPVDAHKLIADCNQERCRLGVVFATDETLPRVMDRRGQIRVD